MACKEAKGLRFCLLPNIVLYIAKYCHFNVLVRLCSILDSNWNIPNLYIDVVCKRILVII